MSITIILADDHAVVRDGLKLLLETKSDLKVISEVENGREAVEAAIENRPRIIMMDITMPELDGIEATRQIREAGLDTLIIILSMHATMTHVFRALQAGAAGYLLKGSASFEVIDAVRAVCAGRRYLSPKLAAKIDDEDLPPLEAPSDLDPLAQLSSREREVFQLVVNGKSNAQIAERLYLSTKTVETYRSRMMSKLQVNDLPSLVKFAVQHELTPLQ